MREILESTGIGLGILLFGLMVFMVISVIIHLIVEAWKRIRGQDDK